MQSLKNMQKLLMILFIGLSSSLWGASTAVVNSTADTDGTSPYTTPETFVGSGIVTLRSAIRFSQGASAVPPTTITFDIPTSDPGFQPATDSWLIQPVAIMGANAAYLINTKPIIIDGYAGNTAHPASPNTNAFADGSNAVLRIEIKGTGTTLPQRAFFVNGVNGCSFKGLCLNNYLGAPSFGLGETILANGSNTTVSGCFIGTNILGTSLVETSVGFFSFGGTGNFYGGNNPADSNVTASSTSIFGAVTIVGGASYTIKRNYIGTDKTGQIAFNQTIGGIYYSSSNNNIIDTNLISGCSGYAIQSNGGSNAHITNNLIGTDATGTRILGNENIGILLLAFDIVNNTIIQNNVISGCGSNGIQLCPFLRVPFSLDSNIIIGNKIGTDITGTKVFGNGRSGIVIENSTNTRVGINPAGIVLSDRNIISGNDNYGIFIGSSSSTTTIDGNIIGSDISGTLAVDSNNNSFGNGFDGIRMGVVQGPVTTTLVGDAQPILANEIVNNLRNGVSIVAASNNNTVAGNFIGVNQNNKKLGNQLNGVNIDAASNNIIG